jgi:hypothetical protein
VTCYGIVLAETARTRISVACELLGVSTSGFYAWASRAPSDRELSRERAQGAMRRAGLSGLVARKRGAHQAAAETDAQVALAHSVGSRPSRPENSGVTRREGGYAR